MASKRSIANLPFQFYGSKWELDSWLIEQLKPEHGETTLVLTHGGAGSPLWGIKKPWPVEVLNDLDCDIMRFFRMCREQSYELAMQILFTPYHRGEWEAAAKTYRERKTADLPDLERARQFAVVMRQSCCHSVGEVWSKVIGHSRRGMASGNSRWMNVPEAVMGVAQRLASVQLECKPALELIDEYDKPTTMFYVDPPYPLSVADSKPYKHQMTDDDHVALCRRLAKVKGSVALSSYKNNIYDRELPGWKLVQTRATCRSSVSATGSVAKEPTRVEAVYKKVRNA